MVFLSNSKIQDLCLQQELQESLNDVTKVIVLSDSSSLLEAKSAATSDTHPHLTLGGSIVGNVGKKRYKNNPTAL